MSIFKKPPGPPAANDPPLTFKHIDTDFSLLKEVDPTSQADKELTKFKRLTADMRELSIRYEQQFNSMFQVAYIKEDYPRSKPWIGRTRDIFHSRLGDLVDIGESVIYKRVK